MHHTSEENRENFVGKPPRLSQVEMTELVLPNDTNLLGNLLGGRLMHWIDIAGAMAASRHSNRIVATVALDSLDFRHPARMGELVMLKAKLTWVGRTSMEVKVSAYAENLKTGNVILTIRHILHLWHWTMKESRLLFRRLYLKRKKRKENLKKPR